MYYIYLDEAYNLTPGTKNQLIVLGGFGTTNAKKVAKTYKRIRKFTLKRSQLGEEIKSFDKIAIKKLIPQIFGSLTNLDVVIYMLKQDKKLIPFHYWQKDKLNYERLYLDLSIRLLGDEWDLRERNNISVTLDNFKTKMSKDKMIEEMLAVLNQKYPDKNFGIQFTDSTSDLNLQITDFLVGSFFRNSKIGFNILDFKSKGLRLSIISNIL